MTATPPKVSIGMPVYNGAEYLSEAIESILAQDFEDFELVISDNASTDDTETICRGYVERDGRVRYHRLDRNMGAAFNYNHVFDQSSGEYFRWAAHDDVLLPGYLRACLGKFTELGDGALKPSVVHVKSEMIDERGQPFRADSIIEILHPRRSVRVYQIVPCMGANAVFGLMRRSTLERTRLIGGFLASDYALLMELALLGQIVQIDEVLFHRRVHVGMSNRANKNTRSLLAWFDPNARSHWLSDIRYVGEYYRSCWCIGNFGFIERLECTLTLSAAVIRKAIRQLRVTQGKYRRKLLAQVFGQNASRSR